MTLISDFQRNSLFPNTSFPFHLATHSSVASLNFEQAFHIFEQLRLLKERESKALSNRSVPLQPFYDWSEEWENLKSHRLVDLSLPAYAGIIQQLKKLLNENEKSTESLVYYKQITDQLNEMVRAQERFSATLRHKMTKEMEAIRKLLGATETLWNRKELTLEEELSSFQTYLELITSTAILEKEYKKAIETFEMLDEQLDTIKISLPTSPSLLNKVFNLGRRIFGRIHTPEASHEEVVKAKKSLKSFLERFKKSVKQDLNFAKKLHTRTKNFFDPEDVEEMEHLMVLSVLDSDPEGVAFQKRMYEELDAAAKILHEEGPNVQLLSEQERTFSLVFYLDHFLKDKDEPEWEMWKSRLEPLLNDVVGFLKRSGSKIPFLTASKEEILEQIARNAWDHLPVYQELVLERSQAEQREIFAQIEQEAIQFMRLTNHSVKIERSKEQADKQVVADLFLQFVSWSSHVHWNREITRKIIEKASLGDSIHFEKGSTEERIHRMNESETFVRAVSGWERVSGGVEEIHRGSQQFVRSLIKKQREREYSTAKEIQTKLKKSLKEILSLQAESHPRMRVLRNEATLFHTQLLKGIETDSFTSCKTTPFDAWIESVQGVCFDLKMIEAQLTHKMDRARFLIHQGSFHEKELIDYGSKHKHLIMQYQLLEALNIPGVNIPIPYGISNTKLTAFINRVVPDVFKHWKELGILFKSYKDSKPFLKSADASILLKTIHQLLKTAFSKPNPDLFDSAFMSWINEIKESEDYLMVRSTGAEDSRQMANAGGNVSKAYVLPEIGALTQAIGEVVASYFGHSSLQNQINAGFNPFEGKLKLAVTTQRLIGESIGGASTLSNIPISLVLFTNEPLYVGSEKFRVMRLSATYGHGEGVVGNLGIASDTILLLQSALHPDRLYILYDNQLKEERLAPMETPHGIKLAKLPNSKEMADQPALSQEMLARLFTWGIITEKYFDNFPTDMEIVIKGDTIYPVQARPVNRPILLPTYLDSSKVTEINSSPIIQKMTGSTVVPGQASVVIITDRSQLLLADTLEEAERIYRKDVHTIVVTSRPEPANSHPVVNFSGLGVPCLHIEEIIQVKKLIEQIAFDQPLVACIQSATLILWDSLKGDVTLFISKGFTIHPAKIGLSLPLKTTLPFEKKLKTNPEITNLIVQLRSATTQQAAQKALLALREQIHSVNISIENLSKKLKALPYEIRLATEYLITLKEISAQAERTLSEMRSVLGRGRLEKLFHAKAIETAFISSNNGLNQYTIEDTPSLITMAEQLITYQSNLSHSAYFLQEFLMGIQEAPFENFANYWKTFLSNLELDVNEGRVVESEVMKFKELTQNIYQAGAFSAWLMTVACPEITKQTSLITLQNLLKSFSSKDREILEEVKVEQSRLKNLRRMIDSISNVESYSKLYDRLIEVSAFYLDREDVENSLATKMKQSSTTRLILLELMNEFVDIFDTAIKKIKADSNVANEVKITKIKELLKAYFSLLKYWSIKIIKSDIIHYHESWNLIDYLSKEEKLLFDRTNEIYQLSPSREFSVAAATLGSAASFDRHLPRSLEDDFTLIHQNLLFCLGLMFREITITQETLLFPTHLVPIFLYIKNFSSSSTYLRGINLVGIQIVKKNIKVKINVPLRNHSAQLVLTHDSTGKMTLEMFFMGLARERWDAFASAAKLLDQLGVLALDEPIYQTAQELCLKWKIDSSNIEFALVYFNHAAKWSLDMIYEDSYMDELDELFESTSLASRWDKALLSSKHRFKTSRPYDRLLKLFIEKQLVLSSIQELSKVLFWSTNTLFMYEHSQHRLVVKIKGILVKYSKQHEINPMLKFNHFLNEYMADNDDEDEDRTLILDLLKNYFDDSFDLNEIFLKTGNFKTF